MDPLKHLNNNTLILNNKTPMSTNTKKVFNYLTLSRSLDNLSKNEGLNYCPDDILSNILDYTGDINDKGLDFYTIVLIIDYDRVYTQREIEFRLRDLRNTIDWCYESPYYQRRPVEQRETINKTNQKINDLQKCKDNTIKIRDKEIYIQYCGICNRYYNGLNSHSSIRSHCNTKTHQKNIKNPKTECSKSRDRRIKELIKLRYKGIYTIADIKYKIIKYEEYFIDRFNKTFFKNKK